MGMERLTGEARDRVRATSLTLIGLLVLVGVAVGLFAVFVGFAQVTAVPGTVVAVSADGREVTVEYVPGGCQRPAGVAVEEGPDVVVLTARVSERVPLRGRSCTAEATAARETVELSAPLGARELRVDPLG